jgi:hypothetical protein
MWLAVFGKKSSSRAIGMGYNRAVMQKVMRQFEASYDREAQK